MILVCQRSKLDTGLDAIKLVADSIVEECVQRYRVDHMSKSPNQIKGLSLEHLQCEVSPMLIFNINKRPYISVGLLYYNCSNDRNYSDTLNQTSHTNYTLTSSRGIGFLYLLILKYSFGRGSLAGLGPLGTLFR